MGDMRKRLNFCAKMDARVVRVVEKMAGYMCLYCGEVSDKFPKGGGELMVRENGPRLMGSVPVDIGFGGFVDGATFDVNGEVIERKDIRLLIKRESIIGGVISLLVLPLK